MERRFTRGYQEGQQFPPMLPAGGGYGQQSSPNRLPAWLSQPKLPLRYSTAGRRARSASLLVGSTPSTRAKVHASPGLAGDPRRAAARHWPRSAPGGLPARGLARAERRSRSAGPRSPRTGRRSLAGASLAAPAGAGSQAPAAQAPAAPASRSCRRSTPSGVAGQGRHRPPQNRGAERLPDHISPGPATGPRQSLAQRYARSVAAAAARRARAASRLGSELA